MACDDSYIFLFLGNTIHTFSKNSSYILPEETNSVHKEIGEVRFLLLYTTEN